MATDVRPQQVATYPNEWEFDALLTDGRVVWVRPIQRTDAVRLSEFHRQLSPETIFRRYFGAHPELSEEETRHAVVIDYRDRMAFLATVADRLVGVASYERLSPLGPVAEVAFVVADDVQHHGVATLLFETLAAYARRLGVGQFVAESLANNSAMLEVFKNTGLASTQMNRDGIVHVEIDLRPTAAYLDRCDEREAVAEAASVRAVLRPGSVAVVGAGRRPGGAGHELVHALLSGDFAGTVYPVNPKARAVCGAPAFPSLSSLPEVPDLAVIALPPAAVGEIVEEAAAIGVRAAVIITAGFSEVGAGGALLEAQMLSVARRRGMRIVGPNCLGVVNNDPEVRLDATFAMLGLQPGRLALISQSGALGVAIARQARVAGLGFSAFASIGNKLDVSSNDLLCFLERDDRTDVIALYLESFGNPRKFARIARRIGRSKPIVALKAGASTSGARGARSHTAAAATPDVVVSALLRDAGVIKVDHLDELLDVSSVLLSGRLPHGRRIALVGNSGGPMILAADACETAGLCVLEFDDPLQGAVAKVVGAAAAVTNPVDLTADGTDAQLEQVLDAVLADDQVDAVIVVVTDLPALSIPQARTAADHAASRSPKPVVACFLGGADASSQGVQRLANLPTPERAAAALAHVSRYAAWRERPERPVSSLSLATPVVAATLDAHPDGGWLDLDEAARMLGELGVPVVQTVGAASANEAALAAESIGFPVVLKARSGDLVHKSDVGGVAVGLKNVHEVRNAYVKMFERLGPAMHGAVVQPIAASGVEAIVGVVSDPLFGPVVMVGLGGVATDLLGDRAFAVPPVGLEEAQALVDSLRTAPLLTGYRGAPAVDRSALVQVVGLISQIADEFPEIAELDCNPIIVSASGVAVVDCKLRLVPSRTGPDPLFRALRPRR